MLEAMKRLGGDPPVRKGAGYNEVYTAAAGFLFSLTGKALALSVFFSLFSAARTMIHKCSAGNFHLQNSTLSIIIEKCVSDGLCRHPIFERTETTT